MRILRRQTRASAATPDRLASGGRRGRAGLLLAGCVALAACSGGGDSQQGPDDLGQAPPPSQAASPSAAAAPTLAIGDFCSKVDVAAVPALIGGPISAAESGSGKPGEPLPGGRTTKNFTCTFGTEPVKKPLSPGGDISQGFSQENRTLTLGVRGQPATAAEFAALEPCEGAVDVPVSGLGEMATASICSSNEGKDKNVSVRALLGDALYFCNLSRPAAEITPELITTAVEFCVSTPSDVA